MTKGKDGVARGLARVLDEAAIDIFKELAKPKKRGQALNTTFSKGKADPEGSFWRRRSVGDDAEKRRGKWRVEAGE